MKRIFLSLTACVLTMLWLPGSASAGGRRARRIAAVVRLHEFGESSLSFIVRPWVKTSGYWDTYWELSTAVKLRFDKEGISIPYPQRDVHVIERNA